MWHSTDNAAARGPADRGDALPAEESQALQRLPSVLIVEDEVLIRLSIADFLRDEGLAVVEAASADEARAVFLAGIPIDVVFSDVNMPGESGIALARWVLANHSDVSVIVTSAVATVDDAGELSFVAKPYAPERVLERIMSALGQRASGV